MMNRNLLMSIVIQSIILILFSVKDLRAQYNTSIGIRIGGTSGVSAKYFYKPATAVEGIIGTFGDGFSVTGLLEKYSPVYNAAGLYVYYGGGVHIAFYDGNDNYYSRFGREIDYHKNNNVGFGVNGIVGVEYRLPEGIPIAISLDLKPFIEIGSGGYVACAPDPSIGLKFIIR
jgi:hypothetical protein